ncbi:hypothetical protein EBI_25573 [Enterocytozoon bieneusi H348]|nr:hypothetical protein EBI_25573 [Enterocytozoon bieneusi H348]|eukprot:XP_001828108.1 hypothetical protein EBI_25573 [Enterocytozoon bieneusi H348]
MVKYIDEIKKSIKNLKIHYSDFTETDFISNINKIINDLIDKTENDFNILKNKIEQNYQIYLNKVDSMPNIILSDQDSDSLEILSFDNYDWNCTSDDSILYKPAYIVLQKLNQN